MTLLDPSEIDAALEHGLAWERHGDELVKIHTEGDFVGAIAFVNQVADLAEEMDHHPDIDVRWNKVTLKLTTHSAGGLTNLDLALARQIDSLAD